MVTTGNLLVVVKRRTERKIILLKRMYSVLSAICFALIILPLALPSSPGGFDPLVFILEINFYLPLVLSVAGIILGLIGLKGNVSLYLVSFNACGLAIYIFLTFIAFFGFKEP